MTHVRARFDRRPAFTLVELLVVVGLIGVLVALLLPVLAKARRSASEVQCATILRAWGQAFANYAVQYKGVIPHSGDRSRNRLMYLYQYQPDRPQNESSYIDVLPPLMGRKAWRDYPDFDKPTGDIWQCPLAEILPHDPVTGEPYGFVPSKVGYHSFAMNTYLEADQAYLQPAGSPVDPSFFNLARAKQPTVTLLMFEVTLNPGRCYGGSSNAQACFIGMYPDESPRGLGDRHPHEKGKLGGNLMMLDGHVEWTDRLWDPSLTDPERPPRWNRTWWPN